ncbi:MAG TPA: hypothetical protein PKY59_12180 [Pyrinomonadaceae bacterium]|nr:hypothetical protein [Pyrinomonadaceae bacterium]
MKEETKKIEEEIVETLTLNPNQSFSRRKLMTKLKSVREHSFHLAAFQKILNGLIEEGKIEKHQQLYKVSTYSIAIKPETHFESVKTISNKFTKVS